MPVPRTCFIAEKFLSIKPVPLTFDYLHTLDKIILIYIFRSQNNVKAVSTGKFCGDTLHNINFIYH